MIKKTIQYEDFDGNNITEDFYFHISKLEVVELEVEFEGGLEGHIKKLQETENAKEAYHLFKDVLIKAYGERVNSREFHKSPETQLKFANSPALGELIFSFIEKPEEGAAFLEGCLPKGMVEQSKKAQVARELENSPEVSSSDVPVAPKNFANREDGDFTPEQIIALSDSDYEQWEKSINLTDLSKEQLTAAMKRKSS